jgi:sensor histidine kinase YesM
LLWYSLKNDIYGDFFLKNCKNCFKKVTISDIHKDMKGDYWFGTYVPNYVIRMSNHKFEILTDTTNPLLKVTTRIFLTEDIDSNIWFSADAIARWNRKKNNVDTLIKYVKGQKSFLHGYRVFFDNLGNRWTTLAEGIIIEYRNGKREYLNDNRLKMKHSPILMFNNKIIYVNIYDELIVIDMDTKKYRNYTELDGIIGSEITSKVSIDSINKTLLFASKDHIFETPIEFEAKKKFLEIQLKKLNFGNRKPIYFPSNSIDLDYKQNSFSMDFGVVNFDDPENMQYSYRLSPNSDNAWIDLELPNLRFNDLTSGTYNLEIRLKAKNNEWLPLTKKFNFIINPPFYKSWWFLSFIFLLLSFTIYYYFQSRFKKIKKYAKLDKEISEYEMKALYAQMNPHFVFNCLNSIKEMILSKSNDKASKYLSKFATLIRATMYQSQKNWTSIAENMAYITTYLEMESIRFEKFRFEIIMDENIFPNDVLMASMLLQPLVENAIWHGLRNIDGDKLLIIQLVQNKDMITCTIDDNGIGYNTSIQKTSPTNGIGLTNMRKRIEIINQKYDIAYALTIVDKQNNDAATTGTIATLSFLPYNYSETNE